MAGLSRSDQGGFYGVTCAGGTNHRGVAFCISTNGEEKVLHCFGGLDGWDNGLRATLHLQQWQGCGNPIGGLTLDKNGNFYGTTTDGGYDFGTVFKMTTRGELTYIFAFDGTNGYRPSAELAPDAEGNFYGTAQYGGPNGQPHGGYGTVFKINSEGKLLWFVGFGGTNGVHPNGGLVQGPDGNFYGTTSMGGYTIPDKGQSAQSCGTIFRITTNGVLTTLVTFTNSNGAQPVGRLVLARDGCFYGATRFYNAVGIGSDQVMGNGAIFQMKPEGTFHIVASVGDGDWNVGPEGGLTEGPDGDLYGVTGKSVFKVHFYARHFGDTAPLRLALSKLNAKVPELSEARFEASSHYGENAVTAYFTVSGSSELMLIAKAYDSDEAAKAGLRTDQKWIAVNWNEKQIIGGVDVYAYTNYGRLDFEVGSSTFNFTTRRGKENLLPLLRKASSALISEFKQRANK